MFFLVVAYDHPGPEGRQRRAAARERHLAQAKMNLSVRPVFGASILDDDGEMIGSMLVMDAASRAELDAWLRVEPYVVEDVWRDVSVHPCQVPPAFLKE
ncbi:MAG: hypothetical protein IRZ05_20265 [Micromonosporaceae bacterium]|nr:hypothetical protein [Micromonosporaceae bacterium]